MRKRRIQRRAFIRLPHRVAAVGGHARTPATVGGYVLEGHVPAAEVKRLLATRPKALGLAVPGMPPSAPGMDVPGRKDPYDVLLVGSEGQSKVFATYPK